jgi:hypothetical protein
LAKDDKVTGHALDHMTVKHIENTIGDDKKKASLTTGHLNPKTPTQSGGTGNSGSGSGGGKSSGS